jgi:predicted amidohydrolase
MSFDTLLKGGVLPDGTIADIGVSNGRIAAIAPAIDAEAGEIIDIVGRSGVAALRRSAFSHGCDAVLRTAADQCLGYAA